MPRALVTGATAGVGRAITVELASRGYDLTLVARTMNGSPRGEDLKSVKDRISDKGIKIELIQADLTLPETLRKMEHVVIEGGFDVLVNNAGIGLGNHFENTLTDEELRVLSLNVVAPTVLTKAALEAMFNRENGAGRIMNVSSVSGTGPAWLGTTYGATKAYCTRFTQDIAYSKRVRESRIRLMALVLGHTTSSFHERAGIAPSPKFLTMDANFVARNAVSKLLSRRPPVRYVPGLRYKILDGLLNHCPASLPWRVGMADDFSDEHIRQKL